MKKTLYPSLSISRIAVYLTVFCMISISAVHAKDKEEVYIQVGEYKLVSVFSEDGQMGVSCFYKGSERLGCDENSLVLLKLCEDPTVRESLMKSYVSKEIAEGGGVEESQREIDENLKIYGTDFYNYMDPSDKKFYIDAGLRFEPSETSETVEEATE